MATATIKGRTTAGTGDPEDLTAAQALALIGAETPAGAAAQIAAAVPSRYGHNLLPIFASLETAMAGGASAEIVVIGDSTANGDDEWFEQFADLVRARFPNHRHVKRVINTTTHVWDETLLEAADGESYLYWGADTAAPFASYGNLNVPSFDGAQQFTITMKMRITDWDANNTNEIINRWGSIVNQRQWYIRIETGGIIRMYWIDSGGTQRNIVTTVDANITDDTDFWLQIVWTPDNGSGQAQITVRKRTADTGAFTDVQTRAGTFGTSTLRAPADPTFPAPVAFGDADSTYTRIYKAWIHLGDAGKIISPYFIDQAQHKTDANGPDLLGSPTLLTSNHSRPGNGSNNLLTQLTGDESADDLYFDTGNCVVFINLGLNDSNSGEPVQSSYQLSVWEDIIALHAARNPSAYYVMVAQNPDNRSAIFDRLQANRISGGIRWALRNNYGVADFHSAMLADPRPIADLLDDGIVHPNTVAVDEILVPLLQSHWPNL
jgi:hypothetical protein